MTKADIVDAVYDRLGGYSKRDAAELVELVFQILKDTLEKGETVKVSGCGNFVVRETKARMGRNPQTEKPIEISARKVLTFKPSQVLKSQLNG